jgi:hypothetical protein
MAVLFSGDFHANSCGEMTAVKKETLISRYGQKLYDEINYHIILGDGGFLWPGNKGFEVINFRHLSQRPFPVLCVIGNHDPVLGKQGLPETDIGIGEKVIVVNKEKPFTAYLKRGRAYDIDGYKFLVLGGALSIDKDDRKPGTSWWPNEYWSNKEKSKLFSILKDDKNFDFVLAHTGPDNINRKLFWADGYIDPLKFKDEVAVLNEKVDGQITCKRWLCGHFHLNRKYYDTEKKRGYLYLYKDTVLLRKNELITPFSVKGEEI